MGNKNIFEKNKDKKIKSILILSKIKYYKNIFVIRFQFDA